MNKEIIDYCSRKTHLPFKKVESVLKLMIEEDCTVPFIARYRKEVTGNLDETQIRLVENIHGEYQEIEKRRLFIMEKLHKDEVLTPELKNMIQKAETLSQLEDLYAPYKSKRKTKAQAAKEMGLEPLALELFSSKKNLDQFENEFRANDKVKTFDEALEGINFILIEKIIQTPELKNKLLELYKNSALLVSKVKKGSDKEKEYLKFKDYFDFSEPVKKLFSPKSSHRFLAMVRAKGLKILRLSMEVDMDRALGIVLRSALPVNKGGCYGHIKSLAEIALKKSLNVSVEAEIMTQLKASSDEAAISVFGINLKDLLLAPYLGSKVVMGIDPGIRTGCKVVVVDGTGKLLVNDLIFVQGSGSALKEASKKISFLIDSHKVEYIAIGDGTYGRETLAFLEENIPHLKEDKVKATLVSESGASIYSASEAAIEEFPNFDITVRGAVSIARRFQDPLSELVKIDPKSIGVGQYQHDINQAKLKKSLTSVVEDCVNFVGIDLNTASYHLLSYISGIGPTLAKNVVKFRDKKGKFKNRESLLKVGRFSEKVYQQAAGFLRIYDGKNPLDATFVHPERFQEIESWCSKESLTVQNLIKEKEVMEKFQKDSTLKNKMGEHTFKDIVSSLKAPSQDPRVAFKSTEFEKGLKELCDVTVGSWYTGVVNNITNFGAFVNIGIKESGLVHISQLADKFVSDPMEVVKVGQEIKVKVLEIDLKRKRLSLSCKKD
jgi:uncharacterized protein